MKKIYIFTFLLLFTIALNAQTLVTFSVDMNNVPAEQFNASVDRVTLGGDFQGWSPDPNVFELLDADGNGVYSGAMMVNQTTLKFKYVINTWDPDGFNEFNDATPGVPGACNPNGDREEVVSGAEFMLPIYHYNTCDISDLGIVSSINEVSTIDNIIITPNPVSDRAVITFTNPSNVKHNVFVTSITGQQMNAFYGINGTTLEINATEMAAGIYFVTFVNELGERGTKKLIVQ